jgi:hypothetical protein
LVAMKSCRLPKSGTSIYHVKINHLAHAFRGYRA